MTLREVVGAIDDGDDAMRFTIGRDLHGAFGGAFGGVIGACAVSAARRVAPGRVPASIDIRFLRGLPAGDARARATVLRAGRSATVVEVDIVDGAERDTARATLTLASSDALHPLDHQATAAPALPATYDDAPPWPSLRGVEIPILETLAPRILGRVDAGIASALRVPWDPDEESAAEACCFAADLCVGPPVANACTAGWVPHPNPDLSLRFATGPELQREVVGIGTAVRIARGLAAVSVTVVSAGCIQATGVATSLLLATEGTPR